MLQLGTPESPAPGIRGNSMASDPNGVVAGRIARVERRICVVADDLQIGDARSRRRSSFDLCRTLQWPFDTRPGRIAGTRRDRGRTERCRRRRSRRRSGRGDPNRWGGCPLAPTSALAKSCTSVSLKAPSPLTSSSARRMGADVGVGARPRRATGPPHRRRGRRGPVAVVNGAFSTIAWRVKLVGLLYRSSERSHK